MKPGTGAVVLLGLVLGAGCGHVEQRDAASFRRGPYNFAFYKRHDDAFRAGAAYHFSHGKQHDVLQLTPLAEAERVDAEFEAESRAVLADPPRTEPHMMTWAPHTGQMAWRLYRTIDWTHVLHEQTYDILSEPGVSWDRKGELTDAAVAAYLERNPDAALSPAPLEVTMRRAATMMKPYFGTFRNSYPRSSTFFFVAHWWHPVIYEAMMIGGNDREQDLAVEETHGLTAVALRDRPRRMLLARENMPRYARLSPEASNIFDNLHMLHGIAYDILAYEGWSRAEKRAELYRVLDAMSYQPGDERYVRKFPIPHPDFDPRTYPGWLTTYEGEMNRMMEEMLVEMWPHMSPDGTAEVPARVMEQARLKLTPGMQPGEVEGSLHDALMAVVPDMRMHPEGMEPGRSSQMMVDAMVAAWERKAATLPDVPPIAMDQDPSLPPRERPRLDLVVTPPPEEAP